MRCLPRCAAERAAQTVRPHLGLPRVREEAPAARLRDVPQADRANRAVEGPVKIYNESRVV